jgi:malate dehydrogenase (oxaloacetate-decarboxylating)
MLKGKIEIQNRVSIGSTSEAKNDTLDLIYTPGVAFNAKEISTDKKMAYNYTSKWNNVAIVCDGTRVKVLPNKLDPCTFLFYFFLFLECILSNVGTIYIV